MNKTILHLISLIILTNAQSKTVTYELFVAEKNIKISGKSVKALAVNDSIPAPTLRFQEGDEAKIIVHNQLSNEETSIHWHGLLLPNKYDGVPYLTTKPIKAGSKHIFQFKLKHSGTYWYHSHTGLQEQRGVYGSIVISPKGGEKIKTDKDYVVVLSDWTNEKPMRVMKNLMRGSEIYAIKKGNTQSIYGALKRGKLKNYFSREKNRMAPMDISDVYYDQFWANGNPVYEPTADNGDRVRLRFINAGASTYFYLSSSIGEMQIISADGVDVVPVNVPKILIGMAETYDVLVNIPKSGKYEIRATAQDGSGHASVYLGSGTLHTASDLPKPNLYTMDDMLEGAMESIEVEASIKTNESGGIEKTINHDYLKVPRPPAPYSVLKSYNSTELSSALPLREVELRLTGDMSRYIWSFNGKTLNEDSKIEVQKGERVRFKLINDTMMHHPLHLHGHFFRLLNGQGLYSPLKHTVDVPPMGRRTIEFEANEERDWFFHCHLLYHMDAGMARIVSYAEQGADHNPSYDPKLKNMKMWMADVNIQSNMTMGTAMLRKGREDYYTMWEYGFHNHNKYEVDFGWKHYLNSNLSSIIGYRVSNEHDDRNTFFGGVDYRMPYLIQSEFTVDTDANIRLSLEKEFQITNRLGLIFEAQYDTNPALDDNLDLGISTDFFLNAEISLTAGYTSSHGFGAGLTIRF